MVLDCCLLLLCFRQISSCILRTFIFFLIFAIKNIVLIFFRYFCYIWCFIFFAVLFVCICGTICPAVILCRSYSCFRGLGSICIIIPVFIFAAVWIFILVSPIFMFRRCYSCFWRFGNIWIYVIYSIPICTVFICTVFICTVFICNVIRCAVFGIILLLISIIIILSEEGS